MNIEQMEELAYKEAKKYKLYTDPRFFTLPFTLGFEKALSLKNEWIRVKDRLPKKNKPVLIFADYGKLATAQWSGELWVDWMRAQHTYGSITHWQPLPEPPKQSK